MKVLVFGATGMVGQGVVRECLLDPDVTRVVTVVRRATGQRDDKLRELVHGDFFDFSSLAADFTNVDACFYCLGVTSAGMREADYQRVTCDIALAAATTLVGVSPGATLIFVSGAGADSTERGRLMWARVKGRTENALLRLPFKAVHVFRPGFIQPMHGIRSKTTMYNVMYAVLGPLYPLWKALLPGHVTTTTEVGSAMLAIAKRGTSTRILSNGDINAVAAGR